MLFTMTDNPSRTPYARQHPNADTVWRVLFALAQLGNDGTQRRLLNKQLAINGCPTPPALFLYL